MPGSTLAVVCGTKRECGAALVVTYTGNRLSVSRDWPLPLSPHLSARLRRDVPLSLTHQGTYSEST